jgi:hypothetical protein
VRRSPASFGTMAPTGYESTSAFRSPAVLIGRAVGLIALLFISSHVAAFLVLRVVTRITPADRSSANDPGHLCSHSGCQHHSQGFQTAAGWSASVRRRRRSRFSCNHTAGSGDAAHSANCQLPVMTACRCGAGNLYPCGEYRRTFSTHHAGCGARNTVWWWSTRPGATASERSPAP